jgi:CRISPR-associated protein Csx3
VLDGNAAALAPLASHAHPAPFFQFDARLGWVQPVRLLVSAPPKPGALTFQTQAGPAYTLLELKIAQSYLDYSESAGLQIPPLAENQGVIISGKLPLWLLTGLVLTYQSAPWLAVYQPQLNHAVVISSQQAAYLPGQLVPLQTH